MELTPELIIKHRKLVEATVKSHTSHSKSGKTFTVKQHERKIAGGFKVGDRVMALGAGPGTVVGPGSNDSSVKIKYDGGPTRSHPLKRGIEDLGKHSKGMAKDLKAINREHPITRRENLPGGGVYIERGGKKRKVSTVKQFDRDQEFKRVKHELDQAFSVANKGPMLGIVGMKKYGKKPFSAVFGKRKSDFSNTDKVLQQAHDRYSSSDPFRLKARKK